ncbi:hypothetical protein Ptr902_07739 [Pyrenophora tritici-repentis]|nr:hypothetical protein Ptr902_07739 [Pyrenophora tritici-repentis]
MARFFHDEAFPTIRVGRHWNALGNLEYRATIMGYADQSRRRNIPLVPMQEGDSRSEVLLMLLGSVEELSWEKMEETVECQEEDEQMMGDLATTFDKVMKH